MVTDLQSTLDAIDAATGCQQCGRLITDDSPSGAFCSEVCQAAWNAGIEGALAEFVIEWRHPYDGDLQEPLCERHTGVVRGALGVLGIGHAGMNVPEPTACARCLDDRPPARRIDPRRSR